MENINTKTMGALRKSVRSGAEGGWGLSKADQNRVKEVTPKLKVRKKKSFSKKSLGESPIWRISLDAYKRGVPVDKLIEEAINTIPAKPSDIEKNPFDEDYWDNK